MIAPRMIHSPQIIHHTENNMLPQNNNLHKRYGTNSQCSEPRLHIIFAKCTIGAIIHYHHDNVLF